MKDVNPALVIGLGGTGQWILTYLKKNLLESFGQIPPQVRLLAFDTTSEETEILKGESAEEAARIGQIHLDSGEFVYLGGHIKRICEEIRKGKHRHIASWLRADDYLGGKNNQIGLSDDDFNLARGAGTRRQFGRMAVFYDLALMNQSKVWGKIRDALQAVVSTLEKPRPVEIYVVSSLAGGTGSGMFLDIAHLSRVIAQKQVREVAVRGFLVLHNTFQSVLEVNDVMPNSFAAIRELNRFMTMFGEDYPIDYTDASDLRELHTIYSSKLFDSCFLLDAEREQRSLQTIAPKYGVYPSTANCITMLLDPDAGDTLQQHYKNVNHRVASIQKQKGVALYSSLGTYVYILPAEDIQQSCTLRFAQEFLEKNFARVGGPETLEEAARDARGFLQQGASQSGIRNTAFLQGVALRVSRNIEDPVYVKQIAASGLELLEILQASGEEPQIIELNRQVVRITTLRLEEEVKTSEEYKDPYEGAARRIPQQVEAFKRRYLGESSANSGRRAGGDLPRAFKVYADLNLQRFRDALKEQLSSIFSNAGPYARREDKLGYTQAFLSQLVRAFDDFGDLIERARLQRNQSGDIAHAREDAEAARRYMDETKDKQNLIDRAIRKLPLQAQKNYIDAEQYWIDLEIEESVYAELLNVNKAHRGVVQTLLEDINQWVAMWATGDVTQGRPSVSRLVQDTQAQLRQQRQEKALVPVHHYVTDAAYENMLYKRLSNGRIAHLLERTQWACQDDDGTLSIELTLDGERMPKELRGQSAAEFNLTKLRQAIRPYFADVLRETIAARLAELYKAETLAQEILNFSAQMIKYRREDTAVSKVESQTFVSLDQRDLVPFWNEVEAAMKHRSANIKDVQIITTSDPHRCVVLTAGDLISVTAIESLNEARQQYDLRADKQLLHIFPAEINAVKYEDRMHDYPFYETVRHFTPRVTSLLDNEERLKLFVLAYALGVISVEDSPDKRRRRQYMVRVARERHLEQAFEFPLTEASSRPSLFEAIHTFIFQRPTRPEKETEEVIASVDQRFFVSLRRLDDTIALREEMIKCKWEYLVDEFSRDVLRKYPDLAPRAHAIENEFRVYVYENLRKVNNLELEALNGKVRSWLSENYDLVPRMYHEEIAKSTSRILLLGSKYTLESEGSTVLQRRFQDFIDETVQRFKASYDPDERDLGVIMHMVIWDRIQALTQK